MSRGYKRDNRGRFSGGYGAGALGGKGSKSGGKAASRSKGSPARAGTTRISQPKAVRSKRSAPRGKVRVKLSPKMKKAAITGAVGVGVGLAGRAAINKALPSQKFSTSNRTLAGLQDRVDFSKTSAATSIKDGNLTYSTFSQKEGKGLRAKHTTTTVVTRGTGSKETAIGVVYSYRRAGTRTNIVHGTYLTPANRKKGIGGKALTAHAAHSPNRLHRASMRRSVQGQAFARSQAGGGLRTSKSKKEGNSITSQMNSEWKYNKRSYMDVAKNIKAYKAGGTTRSVDLKSIKRARKIRTRLN